MSTPTFSVIVPAYKQARYLSLCIESVLAQREEDFELIVVDDASPDESAAIVDGYGDPRIRLIRHHTNRGLAATRNSGLQVARGRLIALLDSDDAFDPEKLARHRAFLEANCEIGLSYNARLHIDEEGNGLAFSRPPQAAALAECLLGFPFGTCDVVIRREYIDRVGAFDSTYRYYGEDRDFFARLALEGCRFGRIDRVLSYRRYYRNRRRSNVEASHETAQSVITKILADARFPTDLTGLEQRMRANIDLTWAYEALLNGNSSLGQQLLDTALGRCPELAEFDLGEVGHFFLHQSLLDGGDHERALAQVMASIPEEHIALAAKGEKLIVRGHLIRGIRELMFGRTDNARTHFERVSSSGYEVVEPLSDWLVNQILLVERYRGRERAEVLLDHLDAELAALSNARQRRSIRARVELGRAFAAFDRRRHRAVIRNASRALLYETGNLTNRGVLSILGRSLVAYARAQVVPRSLRRKEHDAHRRRVGGQ